MDISNLKARQCTLTDFLEQHNFCKDVRSNIRSCLRIVLDLGRDPGIQSYEQLFFHVLDLWGIKKGSPRYHRLRHGIGTIWAFDTRGVLPNGKSTGFLCVEKTIDILNPYFRALADKHLTNGLVNGKRERTVYNEHKAAAVFYLHLQRKGATSLDDVAPEMVFSFFHDGEKQIRGNDYRNLVSTALKVVDEDQRESAERIISWLPKIKRAHKLFEFLSRDEGEKIRLCLEDETNRLSSFDRTIGWLLYFYGLRGSDIAKLTLSSIDWENDRLCLIQSKTGYPLLLPINAAVGNSLFDYIVSRVPKVDPKGKVFAPEKEWGNVGVRVTSSARKIFKVAGVRMESGEKGVRVFRHHFVTHLLSKGVLCEVVSRLAGHHSPESIKAYADADYEHLKECAVDISAYPIDENIFRKI